MGLAADDGGFRPVSWDRALLGIAILALLAGARRPTRGGAVLLAALAATTAWTAASWLWSSSPASALEEAQRVALYAAAVGAVVLVARRVPLWGVVAGVTVVACWNLVTRLDGVGAGTGAGAEPVGYANGLALLCVLGLVLLPGLPPAAWAAALPLGAALVLQQSTGAYAALVVAAVVYVVRRPPLRLPLVALAVAGLLAVPFVGGGHERQHYWRVAAREAQAHPVLGSGAGTFVNWWVRDRTAPLSTEEAHSLYVETLAELGPIGLALVLAVFAVPLAAARRPELAAGVAAFAVAATVDFDWELAGVAVPALLVAALAVGDERVRKPLRGRVVVPVVAALGAAALLAYLGNARLAAAQDAAQRGDVATAHADATDALRWQPYSPEPWVVLGDVATRRAERVDAYRRAVRLDPADWSLWQRLASVSSGELRRLAEARTAQLNPLATAGS